MAITILVVNYTSSHDLLSVFRRWGSASSSTASALLADLKAPDFAPCHGFEVANSWTRSMPKFTAQSGVRTLNVSGDSVLDLVFGYGTGLKS